MVIIIYLFIELSHLFNTNNNTSSILLFHLLKSNPTVVRQRIIEREGLLLLYVNCEREGGGGIRLDYSR